MTPTSAIVTTTALGALSAAGFTVAAVLPSQSPGDLPWKDLAGGGAAVLMLAAQVVFLRFLAQERAARTTERDNDRKHIETLQTTFASHNAALLHAIREDHANSRRELADLVRETRK